MPYATVQALLNDVAAYYDDTNALENTLPQSKLLRYLHYCQRTIDEIHNYRSWPWKMASKELSFDDHYAELPMAFANVGPNGMLVGPDNDPWAEISYQDMYYLIKTGRGPTQHLFAQGSELLSLPDPDDEVGTGGQRNAFFRTLVIPNPAAVTGFLLIFETAPPKIDPDADEGDGGLLDAPPLPEQFHHALLMGTVAKLQEAKGDPRDNWRTEYIAALSRQAAIVQPMQSRMRQMPLGPRKW